MTAETTPLEPELLRIVEQYRTCEFATLSKSGVPIAWPTVPLRRPDGTFTLTTSIALPQKAYNIRRDPRVALLFSEPTGSGVEGAPQLLVQGTATCPDEIVTDVRGLEDYWRRLYERQPINRIYGANPVTRRLFDWYYMRLVITVTPMAWSTRPPLALGGSTSSGNALDGVAGDALRRLATFSSAVLGTRDPDGMPGWQRVRVPGPAEGAALALDVPGDADLPAGPASLLAHVARREAVVLAQRGGGRRALRCPVGMAVLSAAGHPRRGRRRFCGDREEHPGPAPDRRKLPGAPLAAPAGDPVARPAPDQAVGVSSPR